LLVDNQEFASIQKAVGLSDPIGIPATHAGASASSAGTVFLNKYPALLNISGMSDQDDVKGNAVRQAGRLATLTRVPGVGTAWDAFYNGKITQEEFKAKSQKALVEYKNSFAYKEAIGRVTERTTAQRAIAAYKAAEEADPYYGADPRLAKAARAAQASLDTTAESALREALQQDNPGAEVFGDNTPEARAYKDKLRRDLAAIEERRINEEIRQGRLEDPDDYYVPAQLQARLGRTQLAATGMTQQEWDDEFNPAGNGD
jgi:hypothetical protein